MEQKKTAVMKRHRKSEASHATARANVSAAPAIASLAADCDHQRSLGGRDGCLV